jgi:hypothetical protein
LFFSNHSFKIADASVGRILAFLLLFLGFIGFNLAGAVMDVSCGETGERSSIMCGGL